jgi:hypothetical protein
LLPDGLEVIEDEYKWPVFPLTRQGVGEITLSILPLYCQPGPHEFRKVTCKVLDRQNIWSHDSGPLREEIDVACTEPNDKGALSLRELMKGGESQ